MFLKRLESVGFKSFAERINVEFVPGVTAVVGPNGSGKSNITDAIRWVLGEQSAKSLRGSKMEDIIFQGSDTRKALNVAEVTLVLDNSDQRLPIDYDEVSVTRRVYRSGDSEFYINKQSCRLKDIVDLFMDSGLGRDAFSIISQGKVEEILSSKAEERRTIFEEAAGVLKYKQRKKKAEYKLAETQENLNRVEDIIYEIEQQIDPLKEQAETAKEFVKLKDLLKEKEIALLATEIEQLNNEWQQAMQQLEKEKMNEIEQKTLIQQKEAAIEQERQLIQKIDNSIEEMQSSLLQTTEQLEKLEGKKQVFNERTKHYAENKEKLEQQKKELMDRLERIKEELHVEKEKLVALQQARKQTKELVVALESKLVNGQEDIAEKIEDLKAQYIEFLNDQAAKRNERQSIQNQLTQITSKHHKQVQRFQDLIATRTELTNSSEHMKKELHEKELEFQSTDNDMKELKQELDATRHTYQESQTKLYQGYQYIEKLKSRKEMLEEMKEDFQGFFHGVKSVLKAREDSKLTHIHGAVIELMEVPKNYITAIETVLGGQAQHIVVQDDQAARKAIAWLKQTNNGRATFLPLESIQQRFITGDILKKVEQHPGFVDIAANLVQTNDTFRRAINHLMGHVIIAKTLKDANEIANLVMRKYRIVTLEGDVVNPGGSMSGGAQKKTNQSLFTREKDLQEITEKLNDFERKAQRFEHSVSEQKSRITEQEQKLMKLEQKLEACNIALQDAKAADKEYEMKLHSINENLSIYDQEEEQHRLDREALETRDIQVEKQLTEIEKELASIQEQIDELSKQENELKENQELLQDDLHQKQVLLAEQEIQVTNQLEKTSSLEEQVSDIEMQLSDCTKELIELVEMKQSNETEEEIDANITASKAEKEKLIIQIQEKRSNRARRTQLQQDRDRELKEENKNHQALVTQIQQLEVRSNRLDVELETKLNHLQTEYVITFEKASQLVEKVENTQEAAEEVRQIKLAIDRLGTVNLGAIGEYDRIAERHSFLSEQQNDLVKAKQTLYDVIAEMDEEMEALFDDTFSKIKEEFAIVFKELFGGGRAELKLTDPKNLLETGVDIIAQPPGKKLQHLGLLSGGERALTAISLLFAILRVRPVPFCILDEVEAALDEANVMRFAKYVKLYSEVTQFIVITHRQGTMENADVLYGVTMQESGVSRLVSVRLEETKELIQS
ncbi:chromosome segregation protein SMC [Virgibacillus sp. MG-45]|uniref:chromosome segregation protein SMC n=1 Tax=Virgibacillus sp. MG-45 TaxID=3102791 RepID=UPI002ED92A8F